MIKSITYLGVAALVGSSLYWAYTEGKHSTQVQWNLYKEQKNVEIQRLNSKYEVAAANHTTQSKKINDEIIQNKSATEVIIRNLRTELASRLLDSKARADIYQRQAQSGAVECGNLANYASELDRTLESGRNLVQELSTTVKQRDSEIKTLGDQILNDRKLFTE